MSLEKFGCSPGGNTHFLPEEGQFGYLKDGLSPIFNFFCVEFNSTMASGDIWIISDFGQYT